MVEKVDTKIINMLLLVLLGLGSWNLHQTFELSKDMVVLKEKVSRMEIIVEKKANNQNKNKNKNKKKKNKKKVN